MGDLVMSIARHHTEWLSLVPVSGPFLSLPVLMEAFSSGLEPHDPDHMRLLRQRYAEWHPAREVCGGRRRMAVSIIGQPDPAGVHREHGTRNAGQGRNHARTS